MSLMRVNDTAEKQKSPRRSPVKDTSAHGGHGVNKFISGFYEMYVSAKSLCPREEQNKKHKPNDQNCALLPPALPLSLPLAAISNSSSLFSRGINFCHGLCVYAARGKKWYLLFMYLEL